MVQWTALIVSGAALIVSGIALYLSSLRAAEIEIDYVASRSAVQPAGMLGGTYMPTRTSMNISLFIWNTGAQGALLEGVTVVATHGDEPPLPWVVIERDDGLRSRPRQDVEPEPFPIAFEAGDTATYFLVASLEPDGAIDPVELARRVRGVDPVRLRLAWRFSRTAGFGTSRRLPHKWRRHRVTETRQLAIEVPADMWRLGLLGYWLMDDETKALIDAALRPGDPNDEQIRHQLEASHPRS